MLRDDLLRLAGRLAARVAGPPGSRRLQALALLYQLGPSSGDGRVEAFAEAIQRLPDVTETEGDLAGERSFRVGRREFLHVHGRILHIILPRGEKEEALASGRAEEHPFAPRSGYVQVRLRADDDVDGALALARVAHAHALARQRAREPPG